MSELIGFISELFMPVFRQIIAEINPLGLTLFILAIAVVFIVNQKYRFKTKTKLYHEQIEIIQDINRARVTSSNIAAKNMRDLYEEKLKFEKYKNEFFEKYLISLNDPLMAKNEMLDMVISKTDKMRKPEANNIKEGAPDDYFGDKSTQESKYSKVRRKNTLDSNSKNLENRI